MGAAVVTQVRVAKVLKAERCFARPHQFCVLDRFRFALTSSCTAMQWNWWGTAFANLCLAVFELLFLLRRFRVQTAPYPTLHGCFFFSSIAESGKKVITYYWKTPHFRISANLAVFLSQHYARTLVVVKVEISSRFLKQHAHQRRVHYSCAPMCSPPQLIAASSVRYRPFCSLLFAGLDDQTTRLCNQWHPVRSCFCNVSVFL